MNARIAATALIIILAGAGMLGMATGANAQSGIYATTVNKPYYAYTGQSFNMYVNNTYGFSNYTVTVYFSGYNLSGFSPTNTYNNFSASDPDFVIPIVAPNATESITMIVKTTAQSGTHAYRTSSEQTIQVIKPIFLHAVVTNKKDADMYNVTVNFYVDNNFVASKTIPDLSAQSTYEVNYTWLNPYLSNGEHSLTVQVNNSLVSIDNGGSSVTTHFYYGHPPNFNWIYYVVAVVGVFMLVMVMGAGRRPRAGERTPKWRK